MPAYLVVPAGKGPFAAIVWGHWYWENSPARNRSEFLDEAVAIATAGVVSVMIDCPVARSGYVADTTPLNEKSIADRIQTIVDMRRAADLLLARTDVDRTRIGYVGHSYNASTRGYLAGIDRRFRAFVLMAGLSDKVDLQSAEYQSARAKIGPERWDAFVAKYAWLDRSLESFTQMCCTVSDTDIGRSLLNEVDVRLSGAALRSVRSALGVFPLLGCRPAG